MKKFQCPFCLQKFNSRGFLINVHTPECETRNDYFKKLLDPSQMVLIKERVDGGLVHKIYIETKTFNGNSIPLDD